jgi:hypothetical protein
MAVARPRHWIHRGTVEAHGVLVDMNLGGEAEARRRVLANWAPGAAVYRLEDGLLLCLAEPSRVATDAAPGLVLVAAGAGVLASAPLSDDELRSLSPAGTAMIRLRGGVARTVAISDGSREDPATWIDLGAFEEARVASLGSEPADEPEAVLETADVDLRSRLGDKLPPPSPEMARVLAALRGETPAAVAVGSWRERIADLWQFLRRLVSSSQARRGSRDPRTPGRDRSGKPGLGWSRSRWRPSFPALDRLLREVLHWTRLSAAIGWRQAQYFSRMLDMFDRGDLDAGLRHAIPVSPEGSETATSPSLGLPQPRMELSLSLDGPRSAATYFLDRDLFSLLRQRYRNAAKKLENDGRIDEAVFVLAELLQDAAAAVALLERHRRFQLAAEIAEARQVAPGLVVRLWFLAGDFRRAIRIARRTGAFADAVLRLERSEPERALELRLVWASSLAEAGNYAGAVRTLWPLAEHRKLAAGWIETGISTGGRVAAELVAYKAALQPERYRECLALARDLLDDSAAETLPCRQALQKALLDLDATAETAGMARLAVRFTVRDAVLHSGGSPHRAALLKLGGDPVLETDVQRLDLGNERRQTRPRQGSWGFRIASDDLGTLEIHDAAYLPNGRLLVALGELGVRLVHRDGRCLTHFAQPAHRLVVSDQGNHAIALAERGEVTRLARLDLVERRARAWCDARLEAFAESFDGSLWIVAGDGAFRVIDCLGENFEMLWRIPDLPGPVHAIARDEVSCAFLVGDGPVACWRLELPSLILRRRDDVALGRRTVESARYAVAPTGRVAVSAIFGDAGELLVSLEEQVRDRWLVEPAVAAAARPVFADPRLGLLSRRSDGVELLLFERAGSTPVVRFLLGGAAKAGFRSQGDVMTLWDERGRLLVCDLVNGSLLRDWRL